MMMNINNSINQYSTNGNGIVGDNVMITHGSNIPPAPLPAEEKIQPHLDGKKIFIVCGHDELLVLQLKDYLQNTLGYSEPVVLSDKSYCGETIIAAFEKEAQNVGVVFVLLTPDDCLADGTRNARQNVIFELGYFVGKFGWQSGRVIVLRKGDVNIPTDISGVFYIKIDHGVAAAGEKIRKALESIK